jgi:hypothetical protein
VERVWLASILSSYIFPWSQWWGIFLLFTDVKFPNHLIQIYIFYASKFGLVLSFLCWLWYVGLLYQFPNYTVQEAIVIPWTALSISQSYSPRSYSDLLARRHKWLLETDKFHLLSSLVIFWRGLVKGTVVTLRPCFLENMDLLKDWSLKHIVQCTT